MSRIRLELSFFPSFCKKVLETSFRIKVRVNQTFFSESFTIRGVKITFFATLGIQSVLEVFQTSSAANT